MSLILTLINTLISFIAGVLTTIFYFGNPFTDPFILEVFISNPEHNDAPIGFKVKNTTQHSLKTDIAITPIVHGGKYSIIKYYVVINPGEEYVVETIKSEYNCIRFINDMHGLNAYNYEHNNQPIKFDLQAHFTNSKLKVLKFHNSVNILTAYDPIGRCFHRVE